MGGEDDVLALSGDQVGRRSTGRDAGGKTRVMSDPSEMRPDTNVGAAAGVAAVLDGRPRDLGGFYVRRTLPSPARRRVGPFTFFDHFGPADFAKGEGMNVRPHPHVGLATVTYLFEGEIVHRDSLGSHRAIHPGDINWMTAGRGIVHSERTSPERRATGARLHGLQLWLALPKEHEEIEPSFFHHPRASMPERTDGGVALRLLAGKAYGMSSPVEALSPLFYVDATLPRGGALALTDEHEERALYVVEGIVDAAGESAEVGRMIVFEPGAKVEIRAEEAARIVLVGGAPLEGERYIDWNFVSSSQERIARAKRDWNEGRFPKVPGDDVEFIPLPE
jgi:redox-sensitive bicupin YhaK (pirin superfamily)